MRLLHTRFLFIPGLAFLLLACNNSDNTSGSISASTTTSVAQINYVVINEFPHDTSLFTEGFLFHNRQLYESTGSPKDDELSFTRSMVGISDLSTGNFDKKIEIDKTKYFGEGIVFFKNKLYQLTYKNQEGFIYDAKTFKQTGTFKYSNREGWSLTTDGTYLIMSDGTDTLTFLNPGNFIPIKKLAVTENNIGVKKLNELEFIKGFIYANVWQTNNIIKIDTANGKVVGKLDLNSLVLEAGNKNVDADVLNGIAYDSSNDKIYVTGKLWANIYEIKFPH